MPNAKPNDLDIAGLRELEANATAERWDAFPFARGVRDGIITNPLDSNGCFRVADTYGPDVEVNTKLIVALRNSAKDLLALAEIGQADAEMTRLEKQLSDESTAAAYKAHDDAVERHDLLMSAYLARKDG